MKLFPETVCASDEERATVCRILCESAAMPGMWTGAFGPTERAREQLERGRGGMSLGQWVYFRAAWTFWDGSGPDQITLREVLEVLDGRYLAPLATLLVAVSQGREAVRAWCARNDVSMLSLP